mgnify:CR=1 FL=1
MRAAPGLHTPRRAPRFPSQIKQIARADVFDQHQHLWVGGDQCRQAKSCKPHMPQHANTHANPGHSSDARPTLYAASSGKKDVLTGREIYHQPPGDEGQKLFNRVAAENVPHRGRLGWQSGKIKRADGAGALKTGNLPQKKGRISFAKPSTPVALAMCSPACLLTF